MAGYDQQQRPPGSGFRTTMLDALGIDPSAADDDIDDNGEQLRTQSTPSTPSRQQRHRRQHNHHHHTGAAAGSGSGSVLPSVHLLPRPDELLLRPPYLLHITHAPGGSVVRIECSHSPSLDLLAAYLKKWCRTNRHRVDKPPMVQITLYQSPFGLATLHDTLDVEVPSSQYGGEPPPLSMPIILHLVESMLGFTLVYSDAKTWHYRRDTLLREP